MDTALRVIQKNISTTAASFTQAARNGDPSSAIAKLDASFLRLPLVTRAYFSPKVQHLTKTPSGSYCHDTMCAQDLPNAVKSMSARCPHPEVEWIPPPSYDWSKAMGRVLARKATGPLDSMEGRRPFSGPPMPESEKRHWQNIMGLDEMELILFWEALHTSKHYHGWDGGE